MRYPTKTLKETTNVEYKMADEDNEKKTADLEEEELTTAVEDEDEEEEDTRSDGQLVYEVLKKRNLVDDGNWDDLTQTLRRGWDQYALDTSMGDLRDEMIDELS